MAQFFIMHGDNFTLTYLHISELEPCSMFSVRKEGP